MTPDRLFIATVAEQDASAALALAESFAHAYGKQTANIDLSRFKTAQALATALEVEEAAMLFIQRGTLPTQRLLNLCRELRIPYVFVNEEWIMKNEELPDGEKENSSFIIKKILVPVTFLPEEKEKGAVAAAIARCFKAEILLMPATDKGSRARRNANALATLFDTFKLNHSEVQARRDSFGVEREAITIAEREAIDLVLITASRSYSIDDLLFGPKERRIINRATVPLMILNPRADLYVLCG